jgi:hypothetical protein
MMATALQLPTKKSSRRQSTALPAFRLTAAKRNTLSLLAEFFCLRVYDTAKLLRGHEPDDNDLRTARRTLHLLWKEGLTHREPYFELDRNRDRGSISYVYGLSDKGVMNLSDSVQLPLYHIYKTFDEHAVRTLDHELEITWFHIALKRFCEKHTLKLYWQQADLKTKTIHPDAYFSIGKDEKWNHFFLEIERSKVSNYRDGEPSILRKLEKYYNLFDSPACEKDWNFKQFRVIIVQRTDERRQNLCNALQSKYPHRMFWLTTEQKYKTNGGMGGEIFLTPKDFQSKSYGFLTIQ